MDTANIVVKLTHTLFKITNMVNDCMKLISDGEETEIFLRILILLTNYKAKNNATNHLAALTFRQNCS